MGIQKTKIIVLITLCLVLLGLGPVWAAQNDLVRISVDATATGESLRHVWQYYGYDECNYTTSSGARELMKTLANINTEPVYLRQHFLLASGDGKPSLKWSSTNIYSEDAAGNPVYYWPIMDEIMDAIVASGSRPLIEIGFMPQDLSVKPTPYKSSDPFGMKGYGVYYPPKDYQKWAELIRQWVRHSAQRYQNVEKTWLWELWNEPNIRYWQGTFEEYCKLFDYTEFALHEILPKASLGGPHTAGAPPFLRQFLEHCLKGKNYVTGQPGTRLDYIGFHSKGRTKYINGHPQMDLGQNLRTNQQGFAIIADFPEFRNTPIIIGECDPEGAAALSSRVHPANGYRNGSAYAAYEVALMKHTLDLAAHQGVNLQGVLTWAFMFDGKDYFEGFRTLSTNGIHKPVLNAFKMLGMLQGRRIPLTSSGALGLEQILEKGIRYKPDIDGLAVATKESVQTLMWNYHDDMVKAAPASVELTIKAPKNNPTRARIAHYRIDVNHSNAYTRWLEFNSPQTLGPDTLARLHAAGELELLEPVRFCDVHNGKVKLNFSLPRYGVSLIGIRWGP
ncbi:MAG: beta-xylosidase [Planctomycetes bacterium]|nr:beta-xylosidase [Planctomycetota bacterium]MBL7144948.1 beta-xylosidase [Phycisphaerae bacterium]